MVTNLMQLLKQSKVATTTNAIYKCVRDKLLRRRIAARYERTWIRSGRTYSEEEAYAAFQDRLRHLRPDFIARPVSRLRVFWVGANRSQDESGFLQSLRRLAQVKVFVDRHGSYGQLFRGKEGRPNQAFHEVAEHNGQSLRQQVEAMVQEGGVDLILGQMWVTYLSLEDLAWVRRFGIPVVNISMDDRLPEHWARANGCPLGAAGLAPATDMVLTTSPETCRWFALEGCPAVFWPLASDPTVFRPDPAVARDIDVLFIGNRYGVREEIVNALDRAGITVTCFGAGWPNGPVDAAQMSTLSVRAKIILGVGTVGHCRDVYTLKLRDFDAPMAGALYLTNRNPDLLRLYREGHEIECYTNAVEAAEKIRYYLRNHSARIAIANRGQELARARDTWDARLTSTFIALGLLQVPAPHEPHSS